MKSHSCFSAWLSSWGRVGNLGASCWAFRETEELEKFFFCILVFGSSWVTFSIFWSETTGFFFEFMNVKNCRSQSLTLLIPYQTPKVLHCLSCGCPQQTAISTELSQHFELPFHPMAQFISTHTCTHKRIPESLAESLLKLASPSLHPICKWKKSQSMTYASI